MEEFDEGNFDGLVPPEETAETENEETETPEPETDEDAEGAEEQEEEESPASEEESEGEGEPQGKKKKGVSERIDKLVREREDMRRERDLYRDLAKKGAGKEAAPEKKEPEPPKKPTQDEYKTYEEYVEALTDWKAKMTFAEEARRFEEKQASKNTAEARERKLQEGISAARKRLPDFDKVVAPVKLNDTAYNLVAGSEIPGELAYYLGKNPDVADRLNALATSDPVDAARRIGNIEAKIQARIKTPSPPRDKTTKPGPAPQKPLGGGKSVSGKNPDEMTNEEYRAMRKEQMKTRR